LVIIARTHLTAAVTVTPTDVHYKHRIR